MPTLLVHWITFPLMWIIFTAVFHVAVNEDTEACLQIVPRLQYSCYRRNLSHIPASIPPSTQHLDFSFNYLTTLKRHTFPMLPFLQHLDLTRCHIQYIDNEAFFNVRNLSVLILTGNPQKYFGRSSINILEEIHKLVLVDMGLFSMESLNLQNLRNLKELKVGTNRLMSMALPNYASSFKNFTLLDLHTNNISVIRAVHTSFLRQMGSNITLILSRNPIAFIETGAFTGLNLREINLLDTFISPKTARLVTGGLSGLHVKRLEIGNFKEMGRIQTYIDSLDSLCFINFEEIHFHQSYFSELPSPILGCISNSTKIFLTRVIITNREHFYFPNLEEISVVQGKMFNLPDILLSHQHSLKKLVINDNIHSPNFDHFVDLPNLEYIDLSRNDLIMSCCDDEFFDIPKLRYLNLSNNAKIKIRTHGILFHSSLEVLDFHGTELHVEYDSPVMQKLRNLKTLDLSYCQLSFKSKVIFYGLNSLKELKIAGNSFAKDIFGHLFVNLTALEVLDVSNCAIEDIPLTSFQGLHQLKHLTLSRNKLTTVDFLTTPSLSKLKSVHADNNHIAIISPNILHNLPSDILLFDLSFNPIECSCSQAEFISWLIDHKSVLKDLQLMSCNPSSKNSRVIDFDSTHCVHKKRMIIVGLCFLAIILFTSFVLVYKYQFSIHYCCILLKGYRTTQQECSYDAFVIYSSKDETWVLDELQENLEKGVPPIQLCLHERDFEAGKPITSNIVDEGIMGSRKVIVVVSQHFLDSSWCRFEFELAQSWFVLRRTAGIIIVILEDVEDKKLKRVFGLHKYLKNNTYLKWKGNALSKVRFWARLRKAIIAK